MHSNSENTTKTKHPINGPKIQKSSHLCDSSYSGKIDKNNLVVKVTHIKPNKIETPESVCSMSTADANKYTDYFYLEEHDFEHFTDQQQPLKVILTDRVPPCSPQFVEAQHDACDCLLCEKEDKLRNKFRRSLQIKKQTNKLNNKLNASSNSDSNVHEASHGNLMVRQISHSIYTLGAKQFI